MFSYNWKLKYSKFTKKNGKVFSCFACGGGSSMGYKLAWFDVVGCNEIDKKMMDRYIANFNPKYTYLEDIREMKERSDLPEELYNLDILDWSPPCSSFSMAGNREKDRWKEKKFREGQSEQVLDTLFFDFIDLAKKLQPKIVVAENVKGMLIGSARDYVSRILEDFDKAWYYTQHFLLDASTMGVPQRRERVFFIWLRKDLATPFMEWISLLDYMPKLKLEFNEKPITYWEIMDGKWRDLSENMKKIWEARRDGDAGMEEWSIRLNGKKAYFSQSFLYKDQVVPTLTSHEDSLVLFDLPKFTSKSEACKIWSYPTDYDFWKTKPHYLIGMSVPPIMMAQVATQIYDQWLSKIRNSFTSIILT